MITYAQAIARTLAELRMVSGPGVHLYSEDFIGHCINMVTRDLLKVAWWPDYMVWETFALDGTTGKTNVDLSTKMDDFTKIRHIWYDTRSDPMMRLPPTTNPTRVKGTAQYWEPLKPDAGLIRILKVTTTGDITLHYMSTVAWFENDSDEIWLDDNLLIYATALKYSVLDNTNSSAIDIFRALFTDRLKEVLGDLSDDEVILVKGKGHIPTEWFPV